MDKVPTPEGLFRPRIYVATSLADMVESRSQVIADEEAIASSLHQPLRAIIKGAYLIDQIFCKLQKIEYTVLSQALVYIPVIRHQFDPEHPEKGDEVTLFDPTVDRYTAHLPHPLIARFMIEGGLNIPADATQNSSWCSDVMLLNRYDPFKGDKSLLIHLENRHITDPERSALLSMVRRLVSVGMPA